MNYIKQRKPVNSLAINYLDKSCDLALWRLELAEFRFDNVTTSEYYQLYV